MTTRAFWLEGGAAVAVLVAAGFAIAHARVDIGAAETPPPVAAGSAASVPASVSGPPVAYAPPSPQPTLAPAPVTSVDGSPGRSSSAGGPGAPIPSGDHMSTCGGMGSVPRVVVSSTGTGEHLTAADAIAVAKKNDEPLKRACFPGDAAASTVAFLDVSAAGAVVDVVVTAPTPTVAACVKRALGRWTFPKRSAPAHVQLAFRGDFDAADR